MSKTPPPTWHPGFYDPGDLVRFAGHLWRCIERGAGRPSDRSPQWERLD